MATVRSILYICGFGALGYGLMTVVTPNESELNKKLLEGRTETKSELLNKRKSFMDVLQSAANEKKPLYRQTKDDLDTFLKK